jgi:hypothetical protein
VGSNIYYENIKGRDHSGDVWYYKQVTKVYLGGIG